MAAEPTLQTALPSSVRLWLHSSSYRMAQYEHASFKNASLPRRHVHVCIKIPHEAVLVHNHLCKIPNQRLQKRRISE